MRNMYYVDMHCHPSIKPFSFFISDRGNPSEVRNVKTSLWYDDPPGESDKELNKHTGLTKFTQSDFRTLTKGDVKIASACLSPIEKGLFTPRGPCKKFGFRLLKFGLELNSDFITRVKSENRNYFGELTEEYDYYKSEQENQQNHSFPTKFELISDFNQIELNLENVDTDIIYIFFSIEGCHAFNNGGLENKIEDEEEVKRRIREVKGWEFRPLYASMAHHIYNDLCGHAKSLPPALGKLVDQTKEMGTGITDMGQVVLKELLDNTNNDRIYIDIKHMSVQAREEYFNILERDYPNDPIPIVVSHGAVTGPELPELGIHENNNYENGNRYQNENELKFNDEDINFSDDEIIAIQKSKGFLGIQLDERRLISPEQLKNERKKERNRGQQLYHQAGLVWKQIRYIAEVLDKEEKYGWGTAAIGSDYDGAVDPPNGYWTSDDFGILEENLIHHASEYFENHIDRITFEENKLNDIPLPKDKAVKVIDLFMQGNALRFLRDFL